MNFMLPSADELAPPRWRRLWWFGAPAVLVLCGGLLWLGAGSRTAARAAAPAVAATVTATQARIVEWPETLSATGSVEAWQEAVIGSQSPGLRLVEVQADVGDVVRKGDLLARFDSRMLRAEEERLAAALAQATATARQAEANRLRALRQQEGGGISAQEVLASSTQAEVATAQVAATRAQLKAKRVQIADAEVRAPDDGIVSARFATLGAVAASGDAMFRLIRQGRLEWRGELTAAQLPRMAVGQGIQLALPQGDVTTARVRRQAPSLDAATRMGRVYADLPAGSAARPGMYARGRIELRQSPALVVPAASLVIRDGRSHVLALVAGGARGSGIAGVRLVPVTPGRRQGTEVELLDGIDVQARVVVEGAGFLDDGDLVRVATEAGR